MNVRPSQRSRRAKPLTTIPQTSTHLGQQLKHKQQVIQKRAVCIVRGKTRTALFA